MGKTASGENTGEQEREYVQLKVDERGRVTIPKSVRSELGIEPNSDVDAYQAGGQLTITPTPSTELDPATAGRDDWTGTTPTDAGESLFGPMDEGADETGQE